MSANQYRFISAVPLRGRARDYRYLTCECFTPRMETGHVALAKQAPRCAPFTDMAYPYKKQATLHD